MTRSTFKWLTESCNSLCFSHFDASFIVRKHALKKKKNERRTFVQLSSGSKNNATHNAYHTSLPPKSQENMLSKNNNNKRKSNMRSTYKWFTESPQLTMLITLRCRLHRCSSPDQKTCFQEHTNTNPDTQHPKRSPTT